MGIFKIDGENFNVGVVSLKREAPFLDKFANRTEDGNLQRDLIGVYRNYTLSFPAIISDNSEYKKLYDKLTEPIEFHEITVPDTIGDITYTAYVTTVTDEIKMYKEGVQKWGNLQVKFIAKEPMGR